MVTIYINFADLELPKLQAKFQNYRTIGSGEEDFKGLKHIWAGRQSGYTKHFYICPFKQREMNKIKLINSCICKWWVCEGL